MLIGVRGEATRWCNTAPSRHDLQALRWSALVIIITLIACYVKKKNRNFFHFFPILHPRTQILCPYITKGTQHQMHSVPQRMGYASIIFSLLAVPDICQVRRRWSEHQRRRKPCQNVRLVNANLIRAKHHNLCTFKLAPYTRQDCQNAYFC